MNRDVAFLVALLMLMAGWRYTMEGLQGGAE